MNRVCLIFREDGMPPIGAVGEVVGEFEGDLEVEFDGFPCPAGPGPDWLCDPRWVVRIEMDKVDIANEALLRIGA